MRPAQTLPVTAGRPSARVGFLTRARAAWRTLRGARPDYQRHGVTGTNKGAGRIYSKETATDLKGRKWIQQAEKMLRTDPEVRSAWRILQSTLLSATWRFEPGAGDSDLAARVADHFNQQFGLAGHASRMCESFEVALRRILLFVATGYRYAELLFDVEDGVVWLTQLADCEPGAHARWNPTEDGRGLKSVLQYSTTGEVRPEEIPVGKLLLLTLEQTGSNWEGEGLLRPAEFWFRLKAYAGDALSVSTERFGMPMPHLQLDEEVADRFGWDENRLKSEIEAKRTEAENLYQSEGSFLLDSPALKWGIFGGDFDPGALNSVVELCNREISKAFLTSFTHLGMSDTGARNVGEVHENVFRRSAINILDQVRAALEQQVVAQLALYNFGLRPGAAEMPKLVHSGLNVDALTESFGAIPGLVSAQVLTPDAALEKSTRLKLGVPITAACERTAEDRQGPLAAYPSAGRPPTEASA